MMCKRILCLTHLQTHRIERISCHDNKSTSIQGCRNCITRLFSQGNFPALTVLILGDSKTSPRRRNPSHKAYIEGQLMHWFHYCSPQKNSPLLLAWLVRVGEASPSTPPRGQMMFKRNVLILGDKSFYEHDNGIRNKKLSQSKQSLISSLKLYSTIN